MKQKIVKNCGGGVTYRNINIDLIKVIAVFLVISVHFFLNTNFYVTPIIGKNMYSAVFFRTLCMMCVPLFMITTGYLMRKKELSKSYYLSLARVLISYFIYVILFILFYYRFFNQEITLSYILFELLDFNSTGYSWYVEMYIGLFLLIPFLNTSYNNLNKKSKKILIGTLLLLTSAPGLFNIKHTITMDYWISLFPFTYYFIGAYISEYKEDFKILPLSLIFIITLIISSLLNIYMSHNTNFIWSVYNDWASIFNVLTTISFFTIITKLNLNKIPYVLKKIIIKLSTLSFAAYLASHLVDKYIYTIYFESSLTCGIANYFKAVPCIFIGSMIIAYFINLLYEVVDKILISKLK